MLEKKYLIMAILTCINAIFMFISFAVYTGAENSEAFNSAFSAFIGWSWLSFTLYSIHKEKEQKD